MKWRGRPGRNGHAGELPLVWLAVAVALAGLAAVSFFKERVGMALGREANTLLAADLSLASDHPLAPALAQEARRRGLTALETVAFPSMARPAARGGGDSRSLLAGIKAVAPGYPLRGQLRVAPAPFAADGPTRNLPEPGACWLDARLAAGLGVSVGDSVGVGQSWLRVTGILTFEGERGGDFIALAPRLLMRTEDLPGTGLLQEGSRAVHRLLLAGPAEAVAAYAAWLKPRLERGQTLETLADARPELRGVLDQAQRYLGLVAVLGVLLAAAAIRLALERHVRRQYDRYALMRCFGASRRRALLLHLRPLLAVGLLAGLAGGVLGWLAQAGLVGLLGDGLGLALPAATLRPLALSVLAGPLLVLAVGLPALVRLGRVPVGRVLRRDLEPPRGADLVAHGAGLALVLGLLIWQAGEPRLPGIEALLRLAEDEAGDGARQCPCRLGGHAQQCRRGDEDPGTAIADDVGDLPRRQVGADRRVEQPAALRRPAHHQKVEPVLHQQRDMVAGLEAQAAQQMGGLVGAAVEFAVGDALAGTRHPIGDLVRRGLCVERRMRHE